jgi:thiamine kinase-like enzyme
MSSPLSPQQIDDVLPRALLDRLDVLRGRQLVVEELGGGLTNRNFKLSTPDGTRFVLRLSSNESTELSVNRAHEHANSRLAADAGVGAPVYGWLEDANVLLIGYLEGTTLDDSSFDSPGILPRVAQSLRQLHEGPQFVNDFNMFAIQAGYQSTVIDQGWRLPAGYLELNEHLPRIRAALEVLSEPSVPCNNDLLAGNFIDDGSKIWLIDYEYSGNNDPCFEIGNIWSENHLSEEQLEELIEAYWGRHRPSKVARAKLWGLMSQYGWTLWASIQDATSRIDFDFWTWGLEKYDRAVATFHSPELSDLLDAVQRPD